MSFSFLSKQEKIQPNPTAVWTARLCCLLCCLWSPAIWLLCGYWCSWDEPERAKLACWETDTFSCPSLYHCFLGHLHKGWLTTVFYFLLVSNSYRANSTSYCSQLKQTWRELPIVISTLNQFYFCIDLSHTEQQVLGRELKNYFWFTVLFCCLALQNFQIQQCKLLSHLERRQQGTFKRYLALYSNAIVPCAVPNQQKVNCCLKSPLCKSLGGYIWWILENFIYIRNKKKIYWNDKNIEQYIRLSWILLFYYSFCNPVTPFLLVNDICTVSYIMPSVPSAVFKSLGTSMYVK